LAATAMMQDGRLVVEAAVTNAGAGHAFPTGISIRNAILLVQATWLGTPLSQLAGPQVPWWADDEVAGKQPGDWAGYPGLGFAKVLEGTVSGQTTRPVLFIDATTVSSDTTLPAGTTAEARIELTLPPGARPGDLLEVEVQLLYRRAWRALAVTKGWTETPAGGPIEIEVANRQLGVTLTTGDFEVFADGFESGGAGAWTGSLGG
ncbi:MAG: hypothetical protein HC897_14635, partial [Thermoanaerobaculia bacterium]|nr:hypothetical protein [Thermoanaerobaculia bacterium]